MLIKLKQTCFKIIPNSSEISFEPNLDELAFSHGAKTLSLHAKNQTLPKTAHVLLFGAKTLSPHAKNTDASLNLRFQGILNINEIEKNC
jgi:hypothetical protein